MSNNNSKMTFEKELMRFWLLKIRNRVSRFLRRKNKQCQWSSAPFTDDVCLFWKNDEIKSSPLLLKKQKKLLFLMEDKEKGIFLEVDKDLRRAGARKSAYLPVCSRGAKCARKNTQHFREYRHSVELNSVVSLTKFIAGSKKAKEKNKKKTSNCKLQINAEKSAAKRPALKCQLPITFGSLPCFKESSNRI